jgi:hypothetical protein
MKHYFSSSPEPDAPVTTPEPDAPVMTPEPDAPVTRPEPDAPVTTPENDAPVTTPEHDATLTRPLATAKPTAVSSVGMYAFSFFTFKEKFCDYIYVPFNFSDHNSLKIFYKLVART